MQDQIQAIINEDGSIMSCLLSEVDSVAPQSPKPHRLELPGGYRLFIEPYGLAFIAKPLDQVSVSAVFVETDGHLFIGFNEGRDSEVHYRTYWNTGNDDQILFGYMDGTCYLLVEESVTGKLYVPPLPNVYSGGSLCMPDSGESDVDIDIQGISQVEALEKHFRLFDASDWNPDLEPSQVARWDLDFTPIPIDQYHPTRGRRYLENQQS